VIALDVESGAGPRRVDLLSYLDAAREERAHEEAYAWIKAVRHLRVGGEPFRSRFTFRGDSLWWFAELYLHKEQAILNVLRVLSAFDALVERDRPLAVTHQGGPYTGVVAQAAAARKVRYAGPGWPRLAPARLLRMDARARALAWGPRLSRLRTGRVAASPARIAAFVHRAFWKADDAGGGAESYIGPVLRALETRLDAGDIRYIGVGPRSNFRARRWWDAIVTREERGSVPIERFAPERALAASRALFRERHVVRRLLWDSAELRAHAVIHGCDCWPLVREQLAGIALLQFPWSARAMDEAAAALEAVAPEIAVTYAEAGGWGRALALECRRRAIPLAGLQHGFIYRHWLNYRHEADETAGDPRNVADAGFPFPAATLLFDDHAARHLISAGRFPQPSLAVTGSARLDELATAMRAITAADVEAVRRSSGVAGDAALVLFAGKEREARQALPALIAAVRAMPAVHLVIKPHPAETPEVYRAVAAGGRNVHVAAAAAALPPLLAAARAVTTVNSTVAIDALSFGVPSVVIGLPNNLTPFVDAGLMLGAGTADEIRAALSKVLYDQEFRSRIERERGAGRAPGDGQAAARSAEAILALAKRGRP
jgi:glycosyltransferase involved in cell wall biosynthesis